MACKCMKDFSMTEMSECDGKARLFKYYLKEKGPWRARKGLGAWERERALERKKGSSQQRDNPDTKGISTFTTKQNRRLRCGNIFPKRQTIPLKDNNFRNKTDSKQKLSPMCVSNHLKKKKKTGRNKKTEPIENWDEQEKSAKIGLSLL